MPNSISDGERVRALFSQIEYPIALFDVILFKFILRVHNNVLMLCTRKINLNSMTSNKAMGYPIRENNALTLSSHDS